MQNILISFESDTAGITTANEALDKVAGKDKKLGEAAIQTNKALDEQIKKIDAGGKSIAAYADKVNNAGKLAASIFGTKTIDQFGKAATGAFAKLIAGGRDVKTAMQTVEQQLRAGVNDALKQAGVSAKEFEQALNTAGITADEFNNLLVEGTLNSDAFKTALENAGKPSKSLKGELSGLKEELSRMEEAGQEGSAQFEEMAIRAGQLENQIGDTARRVRALSSDTANLDAAVEGVQMLGAGFQIAQGASALLGDENEELQETLVKLNAVMAITQGLQQVQVFLRGQSILALKAEKLATNASTVAQQIYAIAVGKSTGAMRAMRLVMMSLGIGVIIAAVVLLVSKIDEWTSSNEENADTIATQKEELEKLTQALDDAAAASEKIRNAQAGGLDGLQRELALLKAKGATAKEVFDQEQKVRDSELFNLKVLLNTHLENKERRAEISKSIADKENEIEAAKLAFNKDQNKQALEDAKKHAENKKAIAERNSKAEFEILQRGLERQKALYQQSVEAEDNSFPMRLLALREYLSVSNSLLDFRRRNELSKADLTSAEIKDIKDKYRVLELEAMDAFNAKAKKLRAASIAEEKAELEAMAGEFVAAENAKQAAIVGNINSLFEGIATSNDKELDERLDAAQKMYNQGLIDLQAYQQKREQIIREYAMRGVRNEIARLEAERATIVAAGISTAQIDRQIFDEKERLRQLDLQQHNAAEQRKTEGSKKAEDDRKKIRDAAVNAAFQVLETVANSYFEGQAQQRQNELNDQLSKLNERKEAELSAKNITEQQKGEINARYAAKERQLKLKAFQEDKKMKKTQALVSAALAIIQSFAQLGPIAGAISAVTVGVATALQIAKIDQATPGFKRGKVGIRGPGTTTSDSIPIRISDNESVINAAATAKYADVLTAINNMEFEKYLATLKPAFFKESSNASLNALPEWAASITVSPPLNIDYERLGKSVAKYAASPAMTMNADSDGLRMFLADGNRRVEVLNKRYKL